jgi:hypothetical protein
VQKTILVLMAREGKGGGRLLELMELFARFLAAEALSELTIHICLTVSSFARKYAFGEIKN